MEGGVFVANSVLRGAIAEFQMGGFASRDGMMGTNVPKAGIMRVL
jgi:hypothetical protein